MIDYQNFKIVHSHGDSWAEMREEHHEHHDSAEHDPEREWGRGAKLFKCVSCEERVVVVPPENFEPEER